MKKKNSFLVLILLLNVQIIIFAPQVGRGFVTDDLTWLENVVPDGKGYRIKNIPGTYVFSYEDNFLK